MSPLGTICTLKPKHARLSAADRMAVQAKQGRAIFGVDLKIVGDDGKELPRDGKASGELMVRGPWVISNYFKGAGGVGPGRELGGRGRPRRTGCGVRRCR